jgi:hypothetical protein
MRIIRLRWSVYIAMEKEGKHLHEKKCKSGRTKMERKSSISNNVYIKLSQWLKNVMTSFDVLTIQNRSFSRFCISKFHFFDISKFWVFGFEISFFGLLFFGLITAIQRNIFKSKTLETHHYWSKQKLFTSSM